MVGGGVFLSLRTHDFSHLLAAFAFLFGVSCCNRYLRRRHFSPVLCFSAFRTCFGQKATGKSRKSDFQSGLAVGAVILGLFPSQK